MEGTKPVDPKESEQALEATHEALARALAGRGLDSSDPDQLLVVHLRAVARTAERKTAQVLSIVGIVVVVVAIVVMVIVLSRSRGSPPRAGGVRPGPARAPGLRPGVPPYVARPYYPPPPVGVNFGIGVVIPLEPGPPPPWIAPTDAWLASRGWFDGDEVELTLELADPRTGAVSWHETVRDGIDPHDGGALSRLLDRALEGQPFGHGDASMPPPPDAPPLPPAGPPPQVRAGAGGRGAPGLKLVETPGLSD